MLGDRPGQPRQKQELPPLRKFSVAFEDVDGKPAHETVESHSIDYGTNMVVFTVGKEFAGQIISQTVRVIVSPRIHATDITPLPSALVN